MFLLEGRNSIAGFAFAILFILTAGLIAPTRAQIVEGYDLSKLPPHLKEKVRINAGAVSILVSGSTCTCARFTEDIRYVVNDVQNPRPSTVRLVPVLGEGGIQNLKDTLFLRGINMAIVDESALTVLKERNPRAYGNIEEKLRYITKLYNAELHVLARREIASIADLDGKTVNFDYKDSETDLVASRVFRQIGVNVNTTYDDQRYALKRLIAGEISAIVVSTGAPQDILTRIGPDEGLHFLPISETSLPGRDLSAIFEQYLPTELSHDAYPNLIAPGEAIPTVASRVILIVYNWPETNVRHQRNAKFVVEFFNRIDEFRNPARHPKWTDVNLAAKVPGWTRYKPAQDWLDENARSSTASIRSAANSASPSEERAAFEQFLAEDGGSRTDKELSEKQKAILFSEFTKFLATQEGQ